MVGAGDPVGKPDRRVELMPGRPGRARADPDGTRMADPAEPAFLISIPIAIVAGPVPAMASWVLIVPVSALIHRHYRDAVRQVPDD